MKGFVYAICQGDKIIYVGSTRQRLFCMRKGTKLPVHKYVEDNGGWINFSFKILEELECETILQLRQRELFFYELHKPIMNKQRPYTDRETYNAQKRVTAKVFREKHPNYHQRYAEKKKEIDKKRCATIVECTCGKSYSLQNKSNHCKTKYHQEHCNE